MLRDVFAPGPLWERLKHLWKPPAWQRPNHTPVRTWKTDEKSPAKTPAADNVSTAI